MKFKIKSPYKPKGDQPKAIKEIVNNINNNIKYQSLLGVTGSGKTFTIANVINKVQKPALIISHNKTLTAQLYREIKEFFPDNAVEYFVSYYDYYQPEAYVPATDTYIEKDASINDEIDRLRLSATSSLMGRKDVIIVASVSFIYGLGSPEDYKDLTLFIKKGMTINRKDILKQLVHIQYIRDDNQFSRSTFRVRGDVFDIHPAYSKSIIRVELFGDEIDRISILENISNNFIEELDKIVIYPAKHFVTTKDKMDKAIKNIKIELNERIEKFKAEKKDFEAHRLYSKTMYDIEMMKELGYCNGIENYSLHLSNRVKGQRPYTLLDYFSDDFILFVDESHVSLSQIRGMYAGDRSRKQTLVNFGFRLPSALDNRPLTFEEFEDLIPQTVYLSATLGDYELNKSNRIVEQVVRPTGLLDPPIDVRTTNGQIDDLLSEIRMRTDKGERTLVTTLTKKMSEDLSEYLAEKGIKIRYLHSDIETIERVEILKDLRSGKFDCLVGINLLREGLDLPEVSLVVILDADKIGFLRSNKSLIQTAGRAARNINGQVIMYADKISPAMKMAIDETYRRRKLQKEYNNKYNIKPKSIKKSIKDILERRHHEEEKKISPINIKDITKKYNKKTKGHKQTLIKNLEKEMLKYAQNLEFEKAAVIRDEIQKLQTK